MVEIVEKALGDYFRWNRMTEIERSELQTYAMEDLRAGKGEVIQTTFSDYSTVLGYSGSKAIPAQLLQSIEGQGRMTVDVFDGAQYRPLRSFPDTGCLSVNGGNIHLRLTIPGRIR